MITPTPVREAAMAPEERTADTEGKANSGIVNSFPSLFIFLQNEPVMLNLIGNFFCDSAYLSEAEIFSRRRQYWIEILGRRCAW